MPSRADAAPAFLWVPELAPGRRRLEGEDSHYLVRVCRARAGDHVTLTDGRGGLARATVQATGSVVELEVGPLDRLDPARGAWILCGAPEEGRADWLVEKLGELGVSVFQPIESERVSWRSAEARIERWRRLAVAALRQSRRRFLLEVRTPLPLERAVAELPEEARCWLADSKGKPVPEALGSRVGLEAAVVGPAPGITAHERAMLLEAGFEAICLSGGRLRTETAALAWAAWWAGGGAGASEQE